MVEHQTDKIMGDTLEDKLMADSHNTRTTRLITQGTNSNCNQAVGQEALHMEDKASTAVVKEDPSKAQDILAEVEGHNQETSVANEVEMVGPNILQLVDQMISTTGRKRLDIKATMMDITRKSSRSQKKKCI